MKNIILTIVFSLLSGLVFGQAEHQPEFDKGVKFIQQEKFREAVKTFSALINKASDPKLKKFCYIYRSFAHGGMNAFPLAIKDLDQAVILDPNDMATYLDRGKAKAQTSDLKGAEDDFKLVLEQDKAGKHGTGALYFLGKLTSQQSRFKESIKYYDELILRIPDNAEYYFNRGWAKGMEFEVESSIEDYNQAIKLKTDYVDAYANRGTAKINLLTTKGNIRPTKEQTQDGCADLQRAKQLGDSSVDDMIFVYCNKK